MIKLMIIRPYAYTIAVVDYIDQMIEAENSERKEGFKMRMTELQEQRKKAVLMEQVQKGELKTKFR